MTECSYQYCENSLRRTKNQIHAVETYSCGTHITYHCSLCNRKIFVTAIKRLFDSQEIINWHFMNCHTLLKVSKNYVSHLDHEPILVNYYFDSINKQRFCYIRKIVKNNPHFIYLIPGFSFSNVLDQFDLGEVPDWRLLAAVRNKQFSCLLCEGRFESFPSKEVFSAHPCNEL